MTEFNSAHHSMSQIKFESFSLLLLGLEARTGCYPQSGGYNTLLVVSALLHQAVLQERARIAKLSLAFIPSRA